MVSQSNMKKQCTSQKLVNLNSYTSKEVMLTLIEYYSQVWDWVPTPDDDHQCQEVGEVSNQKEDTEEAQTLLRQ
ncbi:hypothetical protein EB796_023266 [Bugula neritina]|uniref:Uncharacterized protein n=1 Tax=Bugula neritina TaxID=10212 RepID=A0A7J7IX26_BUGNE|nr:hypothetical protein EB796_023266 [Bugula neritina]